MRSNCERWCGTMMLELCSNRVRAQLLSNCNVLQCFMCFLFDFCTAEYHRAQAPRLCAHIDWPSRGVDFRMKDCLWIKMFAQHSGATSATWTQQNANICVEFTSLTGLKVLLLFFSGNDFLRVYYTSSTCKNIWLHSILCQGPHLSENWVL